ncbi:hypothetical protein NAPIS_ORF01409 [Vairimorpha apis BRL 01]|uniref:Uncharacterized protein n=1 Tax=Vairimorpha apis BRL 01 TaxID=1037528 RepID=T0L0E6_9MICR|nr:hypothetical protein NAPIS_ORF01409 [Vairimorpha apis BRL 01]
MKGHNIINKHKLYLYKDTPADHSHITNKNTFQVLDIWATLMKIETKDIPLIKKIPNSDVYLLMIRDSVCQMAMKNFKNVFEEIQICADLTVFTEFLNLNKKIVLDELLRLSKTHKNYVPLAQACKYINKKLNRKIVDYDNFLISKMNKCPFILMYVFLFIIIYLNNDLKDKKNFKNITIGGFKYCTTITIAYLFIEQTDEEKINS